MATALSRILVLIDHYLPGDKFGGPVRSVANMVEGLGDFFSFWIVTQDRDYSGFGSILWHIREYLESGRSIDGVLHFSRQLLLRQAQANHRGSRP